MARLIIGDLENYSDDSDKKYIKRKYDDNFFSEGEKACLFEIAILKLRFMRKRFIC